MSLEFFFVSCCLVSCAVDVAQDMKVLFICPTGALVFAIQSLLPSQEENSNISVDTLHGALAYTRAKDQKSWSPPSFLRQYHSSFRLLGRSGFFGFPGDCLFCFSGIFFYLLRRVFFLFVIRYCSVLFCCTGMTSLSAMRSLSTTTRSSAVSGILFGSFLTAPSWFYVATSSSFLLLAPIGISNMSARVSSGIKTPTTLTSFWTPSTALPTMLTSSS